MKYETRQDIIKDIKKGFDMVMNAPVRTKIAPIIMGPFQIENYAKMSFKEFEKRWIYSGRPTKEGHRKIKELYEKMKHQGAKNGKTKDDTDQQGKDFRKV